MRDFYLNHVRPFLEARRCSGRIRLLRRTKETTSRRMRRLDSVVVRLAVSVISEPNLAGYGRARRWQVNLSLVMSLLEKRAQPNSQ